MILKLFRHTFLADRTLGVLIVDSQPFSAILEDPVRTMNSATDKVYGKTAIGPGQYNVVVSFSPHFQKKTPEILNVPYFSGIRLHAGETPDDTLGCPLLRPLYDGGPHGPTLTDKLTGMLDGKSALLTIYECR